MVQRIKRRVVQSQYHKSKMIRDTPSSEMVKEYFLCQLLKSERGGLINDYSIKGE